MTAFMLIMGVTVGLVVLYAGFMPMVLERQYARAKQTHYAHATHNLQAQYELLLESILDLDLDYDMGKLSDDIYAEQRKMLLGRSVYILKKLDSVIAPQDDIEAQIEALVAAQRHQNAKPDTDIDVDAQIEAEIAAQRAKVAL